MEDVHKFTCKFAPFNNPITRVQNYTCMHYIFDYASEIHAKKLIKMC